ncbi:HD domain-containing protein [Bacillus thuringiensis]|uniref:HD domain-containing protein n=1 Tax=Bacillus thuringiensis TaxID=1428 RepID=UPI00211D5A8A|nr:HD domain-containing protein [Bacillus thuringiensis]
MNSQNSDLQNIISFVKELEHLKNPLRTAWTKDKRQESVAEHSWRLAPFFFVLEDHFLNIDFNKIIRMCLIHDLGEAYEGDTLAILNIKKPGKTPTRKSIYFKINCFPFGKHTYQDI